MNFQLDFIEKRMHISIKCHAERQYPIGSAKNSCVPGETEKSVRGMINSLFDFACPLRIIDSQRVTQTENGSDLMIYVPPFFVS